MKQSSESGGTPTWVYVVAVVGGVLVLAVIIGIIFLYSRRVGRYKFDSPQIRGTSQISNPLYGHIGPNATTDEGPIAFEPPIDDGIDPNNYVVSPFENAAYNNADDTNSETGFAELEY